MELSNQGNQGGSTASTATRITAAAGAAGMAAASAVVAYYEPTSAGFFPVCPLYVLTGFACPGCGLTRGFHALFHGDWIGALDFNLLLPVWAIIIAYVFVSLIVLSARGRGLKMWPTSPRFMYSFMIALLVFGILRNIPAWPFTILFP